MEELVRSVCNLLIRIFEEKSGGTIHIGVHKGVIQGIPNVWISRLQLQVAKASPAHIRCEDYHWKLFPVYAAQQITSGDHYRDLIKLHNSPHKESGFLPSGNSSRTVLLLQVPHYYEIP